MFQYNLNFSCYTVNYKCTLFHGLLVFQSLSLFKWHLTCSCLTVNFALQGMSLEKYSLHSVLCQSMWLLYFYIQLFLNTICLLYKNAQVKFLWYIIITVNNLLFCQTGKTLVRSWRVVHLVKWMTNQIIGCHSILTYLKNTAFRIHSKFWLFF